MPDAKIIEARQKANLLLRVRDELDAAEYLPEAERMPARIQILAEARREYGPTWDEDDAMGTLDAADDEWCEPDPTETATLQALALSTRVAVS
jgi:hypothetical protein